MTRSYPSNVQSLNEALLTLRPWGENQTGYAIFSLVRSVDSTSHSTTTSTTSTSAGFSFNDRTNSTSTSSRCRSMSTPVSWSSYSFASLSQYSRCRST